MVTIRRILALLLIFALVDLCAQPAQRDIELLYQGTRDAYIRVLVQSDIEIKVMTVWVYRTDRETWEFHGMQVNSKSLVIPEYRFPCDINSAICVGLTFYPADGSSLETSIGIWIN